MPRLTAVLCALLLSACASAGDGEAPLRFDDLGWMAGHWVEEIEGRTTEELWMEPAGGLMLGLNRSLGSGSGFEYLRLEDRPEGIVYVAQPSGRAATDFPLAEAQGQRAVFYRDGEGYPARLIYERLDEDTLRVQIDGGPSSRAKAMIWTFTRR